MNSRSKILASLRETRVPDVPLPALEGEWTTYPDPRRQFMQVLEGVGGRAVEVVDGATLESGVSAIDAYRHASRIWSRVSGVASAGGDWEQITDPHDLESLECCVVPGEFAVAENGAVWLTHEAIPLRAALFVTQHLMLVVPADQIVQNMHEAYERISFDEAQFGIFISGPSKTADIEQSLVIGAWSAILDRAVGGDSLIRRLPTALGRNLWRLAACSLWTETLMLLRLVTYNIHKGIGGVDRLYRLHRVIEAIQHCAPDVVLMQEVDDNVPRSHHHRQVDVLGDALDLPHRAYQANVRLKKGHYGNAILSRFPLVDVQNLELTIPLKKRRRALVAHCRVKSDQHTRTLLLFNVHLGLAGFERTIQLRRVLTSEVLTHTRQDTGVIVAGDYNDVWGSLGRRVLEPAGFKAACFRRRTFPAVLPMRPLDRVYYRGVLEADHSFASRTEMARQASDHLPLVVDFRIPVQ